jgi:hypothetical protein
VANPVSPITLQNVRQHDRPIQDEWGIFDPKQAGLEALLRRLLSPPHDKDIALEPTAPTK